MTEPEKRRRHFLLEAKVLVPNLVFLAIVVLYLMLAGSASDKVQPLVEADANTARRIGALELALQRDPGNLGTALELARLYQNAGEFPWSYDALRNAERTGSKDPAWRMRIGLAYLELGKNQDGVRVLSEASASCEKSPCPQAVQIKLGLFTRMARLFLERNIDSRRHRSAADTALQELLKPVAVDPARMRPKAPAAPPAAPAAREPAPAPSPRAEAGSR